MKKYLSAIVMVVILGSLAVTARAKIVDQEDIPGIPSISPTGYQPLRASILDKEPAHFTIDVRKFANIGVDQDAPYFALYITNTLPTKCGDYRGTDLSNWKPSKYKRAFDLRDHDDIVTAMTSYGCVVLRNTQISG